MSLSHYTAGLRVLDIEHGLRAVQPTGIIEAEFADTLLLGKAANLGLHLRGLNVVPYDGLRYVAGEVGVRATELQTVLRELEEIGWVRLVGSGTDIKRVEVLVPSLRDGFDTIGARWRDLGPSEIEQASVAILAETIARPIDLVELEQRHGLTGDVSRVVVEVGETGTYLKRYRLDDGGRILYSPLYGDNNPEKAHALVKKYGDLEVTALVGRVDAKQGIPYKHLPEEPLLREAILAGLVLAPSVREECFLFTPQQGTAPEETVVLDKARAILACVRYGQHFAGITRIFSPRAIIGKLVDKKQLAPHSEHAEQYGLLVKKGVGQVERVGTRWQFSIIDTEDNMKALRTARDLLDTGTGVSQAVDDSIRLQVLNPPGTYHTPVVERTKLNRAARLGKATDAKVVSEISDIIRGARGG
jgi:hypothetical protein